MTPRLVSRLRAVLTERHADDGVSLVEVIVAISILAVVLTGTASALISSSAATRDSRDRSVGTNIAVEQLSALQAVPFTSLVIGRTTSTVVVDGITYSVTIDLDYVDVESGAGTSCSASSTPGADLDYVVADISVSWPRATGGPATTSSIITPGVGDLDPDKGQIAVTVLDRDAAGAAFRNVRYAAQSPASGFGSQRTTSRGCAYFVNVAPGQYDVSLDDSGYVDFEGNQLSQQTTSVAASTTAPLEFIYDEAASIRVTPVPAVGAPASPLVAPGQGYTVTNTYLGTDQRKEFPGTGHPRVVDGLFPFDAGYGLYAGLCPAAAPVANGAPDTPVAAVDPGDRTDSNLAMHVARITGPPGGTVRAFMDDTAASCTETLEFGTMPANGQLYVLMPYGPWRVSVGTAQATVTFTHGMLATVTEVAL
ncbi:type IV pilus modification PilV family protein [Euzebya rosea]|uniref:type IV pilus modification PilV family protein n=1 Tax=Euzebya rosea TaxID=2052804 RepID=UPI000D3E9732|nr:prepilin-type N-terminal cleavage/methylation domain-containing protein [Euzebya rosea]